MITYKGNWNADFSLLAAVMGNLLAAGITRVGALAICVVNFASVPFIGNRV